MFYSSAESWVLPHCHTRSLIIRFVPSLEEEQDSLSVTKTWWTDIQAALKPAVWLVLTAMKSCIRFVPMCSCVNAYDVWMLILYFYLFIYMCLFFLFVINNKRYCTYNCNFLMLIIIYQFYFTFYLHLFWIYLLLL